MMRGRSAGAIDAIDALAERPVDLELVGVLVQVDFLVRMAAVVMRRHVARDDDHRDRIERGIGDAGRGVGQARARDASAARPACRRRARSRRPRAPRPARGGVEMKRMLALAERVEQAR